MLCGHPAGLALDTHSWVGWVGVAWYPLFSTSTGGILTDAAGLYASTVLDETTCRVWSGPWGEVGAALCSHRWVVSTSEPAERGQSCCCEQRRTEERGR